MRVFLLVLMHVIKGMFNQQGIPTHSAAPDYESHIFRMTASVGYFSFAQAIWASFQRVGIGRLSGKSINSSFLL